MISIPVVVRSILSDVSLESRKGFHLFTWTTCPLSMRVSVFWTCSSCLPAQRTKVAILTTPVAAFRTFRNALPVASGQAAARKHKEDDAYEADDACEIGEEGGAMSRRLAQMTEEAMGDGESSAAKDIQVAGFSEELKKQLEARIAGSAFRGQNQRAFAESEMPVCYPVENPMVSPYVILRV